MTPRESPQPRASVPESERGRPAGLTGQIGLRFEKSGIPKSVLSLLGWCLCGCLLAVVIHWANEFTRRRSGHSTAPSEPTIHGRLPTQFSLTNRTGQTVSHADLENRFVILNLVFTGCGSACLAVNLRMSELQERLGDVDDVTLVSLTIDPRTDTPEVLQRFATRFRATNPRWMFLTGDKTTIYPLIEGLGLSPYVSPTTVNQPADFRDLRYVTLIDDRGAVRGIFDGLGRDMPSAVLRSIDRLRTVRSP